MIISIEGLPGCRKREIYSRIEHELQVRVIRMSEQDREFHKRFLENPSKLGLVYEINRLLGICEQLDIAEDQLVIVDSIFSLRNVYIYYLRDHGWLTDEEVATFERLYHRIMHIPKVMIYLFGSFEKSFERMRSEVKLEQDEQYEYDEEEFKKLHYQFEWVFDTNNCEIPIYKVSVEDDIDSIIRNFREIFDKISLIFTD